MDRNTMNDLAGAKLTWFLLLLLAGFSMGVGIKMLALLTRYAHNISSLFPDIFDCIAVICVSLFMVVICLSNVVGKKLT